MADIRFETGPQARVRQIATQLLHAAQNTAIAGAAPPLVYSAPGQVSPNAYGQAFPKPIANGPRAQYSGAVYVSPQMVRDLGDPGRSSVKQAEQHQSALLGLLHEIAHTRQAPSTFTTTPELVEGGASAFTKLNGGNIIAGAGLGPRYVQPAGNPWYEHAVSSLLAKPGGAEWANRGQFTGAAAPGAAPAPAAAKPKPLLQAFMSTGRAAPKPPTPLAAALTTRRTK